MSVTLNTVDINFSSSPPFSFSLVLFYTPTHRHIRTNTTAFISVPFFSLPPHFTSSLSFSLSISLSLSHKRSQPPTPFPSLSPSFSLSLSLSLFLFLSFSFSLSLSLSLSPDVFISIFVCGKGREKTIGCKKFYFTLNSISPIRSN